MSLFTNDIIYMENSNLDNNNRKTEVSETNFSKVVGYKFNIQKSFIFLFTKN